MGRARFNKNFPHRGGPVASVSALSALPLAAKTQISDYSGNWNFGTTITHAGTGTVQVTDVADPNGSGVQVIQARVKNAYSSLSGGKRAEFQLYGPTDLNYVQLVPGHDYWFAGALMRKVGETFSSAATSNDDHLVFQTHSPVSGADTQPDIALHLQQTGGGLPASQWYFSVSYNTKAQSTWVSQGGSNPDTEATTKIYNESAPTPGQWMRFIIHYRPGYLSSHNPLVDLWVSKNGEAFRNVKTWTGFNTYNQTNPSYPRMGIYKWSTFFDDPITYYETRLYQQEGANLYNEAVAAFGALV
jgi:hypothetical protein